MEAFVYYRYSTQKQERDGKSKDRQVADGMALCARNGWTVRPENTFGDEGRSAWKGDHLRGGKLGEFTRRVAEGEIAPGSAVLVVENLDRLSRQGYEVANDWLREVTGRGVLIATADGTIYDRKKIVSDIATIVSIFVRAERAQDESDRKSGLVTQAFDRKLKAAANGAVITAKCPGWLMPRKDRSGFVEIKDKADTVRLIYQLAADGLGRVAISKRLNDLGIKAWGESKIAPGTWDTTYIAMLLRSPAVEGDYVKGWNNPTKVKKAGSVRITGYYPRVVDAELVAKARAAMDGRKQHGGRNRMQAANLFAGLVTCSNCGSKLYMRVSADGRRSFQCMSAARSRGCTQKESFRYQPFETAALDQILHLAIDDRFFRQADKTGGLAIQVAEARRSVIIGEEEKGRLIRLLRKFDDPDIEAEFRVASRQLVELQDALSAAEDALAAARGAASPEEHLRRVHEVRQSLDHPDPEIRSTARQKVAAALRAVDARAVCMMVDGRRVIVLSLMGLVLLVFTNDGQLLFKQDILENEFKGVKEGTGLSDAEIAALMEQDGGLAPVVATFVRRWVEGQGR